MLKIDEEMSFIGGLRPVEVFCLTVGFVHCQTLKKVPLSNTFLLLILLAIL